MAISNETVINKMIGQLQAATRCEDHSSMIQHISNVKLLSELLLDEYDEKTKIKSSKKQEDKLPAKEIYTADSITPNERDDDGTSIFDF